MSPEVGVVLRHFHQQHKPTALICHGPIALLAAVPKAATFVAALRSAKAISPDPSWIYSGYRMTIFSTAEEKVAEATQLKGKMLFYPQDALTSAGGSVTSGTRWKSNVVRDRELITGQNPFSDAALVAELLASLAQPAGPALKHE